MHWIGAVPASGSQLAAKTRYRMANAPCRVLALDSGRWRAEFDAPQWAPTPGQYLVLYDGERCLGGGVIAQARADESALAPAKAGAKVAALTQ